MSDSKLTPDQIATARALFAEFDESEQNIGLERARQAEIVTKLHSVAGARPYVHNGKTVTPVVRAKKGAPEGVKEAFLRGHNITQAVSLDG